MNDAASNARHVRCLLRACDQGVLSTLSRRFPGYPYGSVVPFVLDHQGQPTILVSRLAEHTLNLEADARTSLVVRHERDDPQAGARLTLLGNASRVECGPPMRARFLRYQPQAQQLLGLGDFSYWRIAPLELRFIAGFGAVRWLPASEFAPPPNTLAQAESDIVANLSAGHPDALRACCRRSLGSAVNNVAVLGVDCDGFDVRADSVRLRFDFPGGGTGCRIGSARNRRDARSRTRRASAMTPASLARAALTSLLALIVLCLAWELPLAPLRPGGSWLVLKVLPLLAPVFGILRLRRYTFQWASMLILGYVAEGAVRTATDTGISRWLAAFELLLALAFFLAAVLYARATRHP